MEMEMEESVEGQRRRQQGEGGKRRQAQPANQSDEVNKKRAGRKLGENRKAE